MSKLRLYFYGPGNLIGMAMACLGPILLFAGVIDRAWWLVSLGAYGAGWAAGALFYEDVVVEQKVAMTLEDLQRFLCKLLAEHGKKLPQEAVAHLQSIHNSLVEALPKFHELFERSGSPGREWVTFRQVIVSYLPQTLGNYLRLPPTYAAMHKIGNTGKTPKVLLIEQLTVMDMELQAAVKQLFESDVTQMLATSKFLEQKFAKATDFV